LPKIKPYGGRTSSYAYYGGYVLRKFCSIAPYLGFVPKANTLGRKHGISALIEIRNEPWIKPSLLSIKDFADEIIVVDSSIDDTPERVRNAVKEYGLKLEYFYRVCDLREASEIALRRSSCEWLLKWDGDFVAYSSKLRRLKEFIMGLQKEKYYVIEFPLLCLDMDLFHVMTKSPYHVEGWIRKYSPSLRYAKYPNARTETLLRFPKFYEKIYLESVYAMHLRSVKPSWRLLERRYQTSWMGEKNKEKYSYSFERYLKSCVKRDYGTKKLDEIARVS